MTYLEPHREGAHQHYDGHHILNYDDDFAIYRLGLEPERAAYNFYGLRLLDKQRRHYAGKDAQHGYKAQNQQYIDGCNSLEDRNPVIQQAGNRRGECFRKQDGHQH